MKTVHTFARISALRDVKGWALGPQRALVIVEGYRPFELEGVETPEEHREDMVGGVLASTSFGEFGYVALREEDGWGDTERGWSCGYVPQELEGVIADTLRELFPPTTVSRKIDPAAYEAELGRRAAYEVAETRRREAVFAGICKARAAYEAANAAFIAEGRADLSVDANRAAFIAATRAKQAAFAAYVEARKAA